MKQTDLNAFLRRSETMGVHFFTKDALQRAFPDDDAIALERSLFRHVTAGRIDRPARNVYASPRVGLDLPCAWAAFVKFVRPLDRWYLSLETRLSELGAISQVASVVTLVSSGRSNTYDKTPYGKIEVCHRSVLPEVEELDWDDRRGVWLASPDQAYADMKALARGARDLVDLDELKAAQEEFEPYDLYSRPGATP
jgi:hypothetical protein